MNPSTRDGAGGGRTQGAGLTIALLLTLLLPTLAAADANLTPIGHHDITEGEVNGNDCVAAGWAVDPDDPAARLTVSVSLDGVEVGTVVAEEFRQDLLDLGISDGFSGWSIDLLGIATTDATHVVLARAQDAQTGEWHDLESTPKSMTCGNATPIGFHDGLEGTVPNYECVAFGWAVDRDDLAARLQVRILVDGDEVVSGTADLLREDLIESGDSPDGLAGFAFDLRELIAPVVPHEVLAQARDTNTGAWFDLNATPRTLRCADDPAASPFIGSWTSPDPSDGSTETFTVSGGPASLQVTYRDDVATVCADAGAGSTAFVARGTAGLMAPDVIEITLHDARCGSQVLPIDVVFQLVHLAEADELTDGDRTWTPVGDR